ncbi:hypothetical protein J6590_076830 [Homalodisca vitripennis]|nr:hypothetical protein J6590_076830 [Homalodisca vitripennis]
MFSDDELLLIYGAVACVIVKRRKRQVKRNQWTKDWLLNRAQYSHVNLLKELRFHPKDWHNYLRMNEETFFSPKQLYELKNSLLQELIALTTQCNVNKKNTFSKSAVTWKRAINFTDYGHSSKHAG